MRRSLQASIAAAAVLMSATFGWALVNPQLFSHLRLSTSADPPAAQPDSAPSPQVKAENRGESQPAASPQSRERSASSAALKIEVARIEAGGASVLAGRAPAGQRVTILANGREIATTVASEDGQWAVIVSKGMPSGAVDLSLVAADPDGGRETRTAAVQVVVPATAGEERVGLATTTRAAPAKPVATRPPVAAPSAKEASTAEMARFEALVEKARVEPQAPPAGPGPAAPVPVPITFETGEAAMTATGRKAASLLAEYLRLTRPQSIVLSGHADSRGSDGFNMLLSRRRLEAIESFLRREGYAGGLDLQPKGESEPYQGVDRARAAREEVWQADRRVELRLTH